MAEKRVTNDDCSRPVAADHAYGYE